MRVSDAIKKLDMIRASLGDIEIEGLRDITTTQKQVKRIVGGIRVEYVAVPQIYTQPKQWKWHTFTRF